MYKQIKKEVYEANMLLEKYDLVIFTWGNVSKIDREQGIVCIKPSGVPYNHMQSKDMVVVDLEGNTIEGEYNPSSDLKTHLEIYKNFNQINSVCHTHSLYATSYAQAKRSIKCFGTTHADYFYGDIPCTRELTYEEVKKDYEKSTGEVIVETIKKKNIDIGSIPAILVANHGPFTFGDKAKDCVLNAKYLETVANMSLNSLLINEEVKAIPDYICDKHYLRKHGVNSYYGQKQL